MVFKRRHRSTPSISTCYICSPRPQNPRTFVLTDTRNLAPSQTWFQLNGCPISRLQDPPNISFGALALDSITLRCSAMARLDGAIPRARAEIFNYPKRPNRFTVLIWNVTLLGPQRQEWRQEFTAANETTYLFDPLRVRFCVRSFRMFALLLVLMHISSVSHDHHAHLGIVLQLKFTLDKNCR